MPESDIERRVRDFQTGQFDTVENRLPGAGDNPDIRRGREHRRNAAIPPATGGGGLAGIWNGIMGVAGLAGAILGLVIGANLLDEGWIGLVAMAGGAVAGFAIAITPFVLLSGLVRGLREKLLWSRQSQTNTSETLREFWGNKFGHAPEPALINAVADNGAAWVMDRKGNFILRMLNGKRLFVGHERDDDGKDRLTIDTRGGRGFDIDDARHRVLAHRSLGQRKIKLHGGNARFRRLMWAVARLSGLEVDGYQPDAKALLLLQELRDGNRIAPPA